MTVSGSTRTIVDARLTVPSPPRQLVLRPAIAERLEASRGQPVTLVCAPAGYGKTTTVATWLQPCAPGSSAAAGKTANLVAWYSIDEGDDNLFTFVAYLVAAIERLLPDACRRAAASLHAADLPAPAHLATLLLADLAQLPHPLVIVLDDYHHIHSAAVHRLMAAVVRHPPPLLHLVVVTRTVPSLPLAKLRAANAVTELSASHLAFNHPEVDQLLATILGRAADSETVASLHAKTEGWVAGLRLLALASRSKDDSARLIPESERRSQHLLFDYLTQEVLANLPAPVLTFLLETSILTTLNAALCDAVRNCRREDEPPGAALLRQLTQQNLFLAELDEQDGWYRYHPQFQACLRKQLRLQYSPAAIQQLQLRAADWYGDHGYVTESMQAYLAAEMPVQAADQLELALPDLYRGEKMQQLQHLVRLLPPRLVAERPALLMLQCWLAELRSQWAVMRKCVEDAARMLASPTGPPGPTPAQTVWGEINAARSYYLVTGAPLAEQQTSAERALTLLPTDHIQGRGFALISLARIYRWQGRLQEAEHLLEAVLKERGLHPDPLTLRLLNALTLHHVYTLQLDQAERAGQIYLALAGEGSLKLSMGFAHSLLGMVACLRTDLGEADRHFAANAADLQAVRAAVLMAQLYFYIRLAGDQDIYRQQAIAAVLERLHQLARQYGSAEMLHTVEALQAIAMLQRGNTRAAARWADTRSLPSIVPGKPLEALIWIRCKLADGAEPALEEAKEAAAKVAAISAEFHDAAFHLEAQVLWSLIAHAQGREPESLALLGPAAGLAVARHAPLAFMGYGPVMVGLLHRLAAEPPLNNAATVLLDTIGKTSGRGAPECVSAQAAVGARQMLQYETLTPRELQMLELLARRLSNKEIADSLMISPHTVRNHLANLYAKLGVDSRRAAVAQAQRLGLFPATAQPNW